MSRPREEIGEGYLTPPSRIAVEDDKGLPASGAISFILGLCRNIISRINGRLTFGSVVDGRWSGNFDGQWRIVDSPAIPNTAFEVEHGLGRIPQGFFFNSNQMDSTYAIDADRASWNKRTIRLRTGTGSTRTYLLIF